MTEELKSNPYGFCPICGKPGVSRERRPDGNDKCQAGHQYPSMAASRQDSDDIITELQSKLSAAEEEIERLKLALDNIKSHQEISAGSLHNLSATWHIADKALSSDAKQ